MTPPDEGPAERAFHEFLHEWEETNGDEPKAISLMFTHLGRMAAQTCDRLATMERRFWMGMGGVAALVSTGIIVEVLTR